MTELVASRFEIPEYLNSISYSSYFNIYSTISYRIIRWELIRQAPVKQQIMSTKWNAWDRRNGVDRLPRSGGTDFCL